MEINIQGVNITLTDEQLKQIAEQTQSKHWTEKLVQPKNYYFIGDSLGCISVCNSGDTYRRKPQHTFKTYEQAQLLADKCTLMVEMHNFAHAMNEGWVADWMDENQDKHGFIIIENKLATGFCQSLHYA